jgi:signal transduction histidine kinase
MRSLPRRRRQRSIRTLLALIFVIPLLSLLGLWGFAASVTLTSALHEQEFSTENTLYGGSATGLGTQLGNERQLAFEYLSSGGRFPDATRQMVQGQFALTQAQVTSFEKRVQSGPGPFQPDSWPALKYYEAELGPQHLGQLEGEVLAGTISPVSAFNAYNTIISAQFGVYNQLTNVGNTSLYVQATSSLEVGRSLDMAERELTLISGAFAGGGNMTRQERLIFAQTAASQHLLMSDALSKLAPALGSGYAAVTRSADYRAWVGFENAIDSSIGAKGPIPVSPQAFQIVAGPLFKAYEAGDMQDRAALVAQGTKVGDQLLLELGLAAGAGLLAVLLSIFLMLRFGRRISRELTGLQRAALELAQDRLPAVVARLSQGEDIDVAAEAAPLEPGRIVETARVAEAFSSVQRTAVEAAVGQARMRRGISQVFRNLAWRSQSLLHRQLALLDTMERRQTEPETLDELFQLDHLTTRMRRHAEGLIILSGASPGRGWRDPVPVMDVLRGAIAEVEDYKRVTVICDSQDAVVGSAVADVIHLLAELIENATTFSPASTEVTLRAERVANGFVAEIEDRGIGINQDDIAIFNDHLANPPEFDLADSNQLGLFVVSRLAAKHRISVTLRRSPYGGTSAIVLLPNSIVASAEHRALESFDAFRPELPAGLPARNGNGAQVLASAEPAGWGNGLPAADQPPALSFGQVSPYAQAEPGQPPALSFGQVSPHAQAEPDQPPALSFGQVSPYAQAEPDQWSAPSVWDTRSRPAAPATPVPPAAPAIPVARVVPAAPPAPSAASTGAASTEATGTVRPWLPRRERQASLAPQLKTDTTAAVDDSQSDGFDGPSPAGSRALVESLQLGLDLARATPANPAEPWPGGDQPWAGDAWPSTESWPSGQWQAPIRQDRPATAEDAEGQ